MREKNKDRRHLKVRKKSDLRKWRVSREGDTDWLGRDATDGLIPAAGFP